MMDQADSGGHSPVLETSSELSRRITGDLAKLVEYKVR
eukprot:SAG25_NODE_24_length_22161_cov_23.692405_20_plen_38_part_00